MLLQGSEYKKAFVEVSSHKNSAWSGEGLRLHITWVKDRI